MITSNYQIAIFAGGCFWCTEAIFKRIKGVISVTSGYTGGDTPNPTYEQVSLEITGHVEAIRIEFDPAIISYPQLLEIFWATHDPTTLNQQGADIGTQYRSAIYYTTEEQQQQAEASKQRLEKNGQLSDKVVTTIEPFQTFYNAEDYHQNYYELNRNTNRYCSIVIDPKVKKLLEKFNDHVKEEFLNNR